MTGDTPLTRDEFAAQRTPPIRPGRLILPCGPDRGCDYEECRGWAEVHEDPFELRYWTLEEIQEAIEYRRSLAQADDDATPYCANSCGRPAVGETTVAVEVRPEMADLVGDGGLIEKVELMCAECLGAGHG